MREQVGEKTLESVNIAWDQHRQAMTTELMDKTLQKKT